MARRRENLLTALLMLVALGLLAWNLYPRLTVQRVAMPLLQPPIEVEVSGAVVRPGLYELPWGSRVLDAIKQAGGLLPSAEVGLINIADPLTAGEAVVVPFKSTPEGEALLSLNTASERELELLLPGVGPATAQAIVENRPYESVEDLLDVPGIGPATLEEIRPYVKP